MAAIGNVQTMYLNTVDNLGNIYQTNISKGFSVNPAATYRQVDTASRAINSLMTNNYMDTILITSVSVNEVLAEEEEP